MYCPSCGTQNLTDNDIRFCRSCGADLRVISKAMNRSLPVRVASALDSYFENRYQQNLRNGVINLIAFVFLLIVAIGYLISGWTGYGIFMMVLAVISIVTGAWDIWIYRRNLPTTAKQSELPGSNTKQVGKSDNVPHNSITEQTTKHLNEIRRPN